MALTESSPSPVNEAEDVVSVVVTLPACGRCILPAGRLYSFSTGFLRHPRIAMKVRFEHIQCPRPRSIKDSKRDLFRALQQVAAGLRPTGQLPQ